MAQIEDWMCDYLAAFLTSPVWTTPLHSFIDENCLIFDGEEENKFSYTEVHQNFCQLVETLLSSNLTELGVSEEQFVGACAAGVRSENEIYRTTFGKILTLDDFLAFKKMMVKRNKELELEALSELANRPSAPPEETDDTAETEEETEEEKELKLAIRLSQEAMLLGQQQAAAQNTMSEEEFQAAMQASVLEQELKQRQFESEQADLEAAIAMSLAIEQERLRQLELAAQEAAQQTSAPEPAPAPQPEPEPEPEPEPPTTASVPARPKFRKPRKLGALKVKKRIVMPNLSEIKRQQEVLQVTQQRAEEQFAQNRQAAVQRRQEQEKVMAEQAQVNKAELERRRQFLLLQRQKILAKKNKERQNELKQFTHQQTIDVEDQGPTADEIAEAKRREVEALLNENFEQEERKRHQEEMQAKQRALDAQLSQMTSLREAKNNSAETDRQALLVQERERRLKLRSLHTNIQAFNVNDE